MGNLLRINIPEYNWINCERIGNVKDSYAEYKQDFEYSRDPEVKAI